MSPQEVIKMAESQGAKGPKLTEGVAQQPVTVGERSLTAVPDKAEYQVVDPARAQAMVDEAVGKDVGKPIVATRPPIDTFPLSGGVFDGNGQFHETVRIREMNGADEEELARPYAQNMASFVDVIVNRLVLDFDGVKPSKEVLGELLIGDRDAIVIWGRILTYGPKMEVPVRCPFCNDDFTIGLDLEKDVPIKQLPGDKRQRTRELTLPRGEIARVNLMTGHAQMATFVGASEDANDAERSSIMMRECVHSINDEIVTSVNTIRELSSSARRALLSYLRENTCGPQWQEVKQGCPNCQREFDLPLSLAALFL